MKYLKVLALAFTAGLVGNLATADNIPEPGDSEAGKALYARYCVACHGEQADGNGAMRPVLVIAPVDLRRLAADNGGDFPLKRVVWRIDGRDPVLSHGSMMPVYGEVFAAGPPETLRTSAGQPLMTTEPMADLVAFLRDIQIE
ncbi:c-type cytochrome [Roseovarius aestuariivivens]|uniref:c-type cytochrome n=1 Tax=Roseovarius aestuariivivens TaxID=1888910 RepID=UPI0010805FE1|nr:cytochrome c [Roseovarius aestuariivivens]